MRYLMKPRDAQQVHIFATCSRANYGVAMATYESGLASLQKLSVQVGELQREAERLAQAALLAEDEPLFPEFVPKSPDERRTEGTLHVLGLASEVARAAQAIEDQYIELAMTKSAANNTQIRAKTGRAKTTLIRKRRDLGI